MKSVCLFLFVVSSLLFSAGSLGAQDSLQLVGAAFDARCTQWVDSVMAGMTRQEKMGQLLMAIVPARGDKSVRKQVRECVRKYKIGGLLFSEGTPEGLAALIPVAQKAARLPLIVALDGEGKLSVRLGERAGFPCREALACIADNYPAEDNGLELVRGWRGLGLHVLWAPKADRDVWLVCEGTAVSEESEALEGGKLTEAEIEDRCRKILACKYRLGLRAKSGKSRSDREGLRIASEEARTLAATLRKKAVTVLNNSFGLLPLAPPVGRGGIAVLSMGEPAVDSAFVDAMQRHGSIDCFRLPWNASAEEKKVLKQQLNAYSRVVVSVAGADYVSDADVDFLETLSLRAPLAYVFFTSHRLLPLMLPALVKANAVILAHSGEADLQQYVAKVLFAEEVADGRLSMSVGHLFPAGAGCDIMPGMAPMDWMPDDCGMKSYVLQGIDDVARGGLQAGAYPGCRILIWKDGKTVYDKGFGCHSNRDSTAVCSTDLFDLGALTKTHATLLAVMKLYDDGKLKLDDEASDYLPFLRGTDKRHLTIRQLLKHESGLPPYIRFYMEIIDPYSVHGPYAQSWKDQWHQTRVSEHSYYCSDFRFKRGLMAGEEDAVHTLHVADGMWLNHGFKNTVLRTIARCALERNRAADSDLDFILLQQIVEHITQLPLDRYVAKEFYLPMGLQRTLFCPLEKLPKADIMPTAFNDFLRRQDLCGYVHDETAALLGGVAGHAGLFSTASEVAAICQMWLNGGTWKGKRFLSEETCRLFTTEKSLVSRRGLGFDRPDTALVQRSPCAPSAPESVYGHTGFTGTCAWVDPENHVVFVFLSNRMCPDVWNTRLGDMDIMTDIQELIFDSLKNKED